MKNSRTLLSALALASATLLAPHAHAGKIDNVNQSITLVDNKAVIEHLIKGGNAGASFSDRYSFSTAAGGDLNAILFPRAKNDNSALSITGFSLFDGNGNFIASAGAAPGSDGGWLIDFDDLGAGSYYLQVNGALTSNAAVKYLANVSIGPDQIAAIPEPAPGLLMLAGLGLLGLVSRRRRPVTRQ
jgi:hypothetical protein